MDVNMRDQGPVETARLNAGESLLGLSTKSGIARNTLRRKIANPHTFTLAELSAVAGVFEADPTEWATQIWGRA